MLDVQLDVKLYEEMSVELEKEPGVYYRCVVMAQEGNMLRLIVRDKYTTKLNHRHLRSYMATHGVSQAELSNILGIARSTMHRYLSGEREIPQKYFSILGITLPDTEMVKQRTRDRLTGIAATVHSVMKKMDEIVAEWT